MSDLRDDLTDLTGVGEATADKILDVYDQHAMDSVEDGVQEICGKATEQGFCTYPVDDCPEHDNDDLNERLLEKAIEAAQSGDDREAAVFLRRASR